MVFHQTISLYRNYQNIGSIIVPDQNVSVSRASNESYFKLSIFINLLISSK